MNISLSPPLETYINKKVESGLYNSASEVVREALRRLQEQEEDRERQAKLDELLMCRLSKVGENSLPSSDVRLSVIASLKSDESQD